MPDVEFVNPELAREHGARFVALDSQSNAARADSWFVMLAVADQVGPTSNVGARGIQWHPPSKGRTRGQYKIRALCRDGHHAATESGGPGTLDEARRSPWIDRAQKIMGEVIDAHGGSEPLWRWSNGLGDALLDAVASTEQGREWIAARKTAATLLMRMVNVADRYGRDDVYSAASLTAHSHFLPFENRAELIRQFPNSSEAAAKAMSLRHATRNRFGALARGEAVPDEDGIEPTKVRVLASPTAVRRLATTSGVNARTSRVVLQAAMDGCPERKLVRLAREAVRMAAEIEARETTKVA